MKKTIALLAALVMGATLFAGCGGSTAATSEAPASSAPAASSEAAPAGDASSQAASEAAPAGDAALPETFILGLDASFNAAWDERIEKLYNNMRLWFFSPVTAYPVEYFSLQDNKRTPGNASWVTKGLHIPYLKEEERAELMRLFRSVCDTARPFCGMGPVKYEAYNYTLLGLMENGFADEARTLCETAVRDITRAGIHSEGYCYSPADTTPLPEGVRPSMFGAAMLIDNVYLMNGVRMDDGLPVLANYFAYDGSLENIQVDGASFHVKKTGNTYTYGGTAIGENRSLEAAANGLAFPFEGTGVHPLH